METLSIDQLNKPILLIRSHKVMLSSHLAQPFGVEVHALDQAVKRNFLNAHYLAKQDLLYLGDIN